MPHVLFALLFNKLKIHVITRFISKSFNRKNEMFWNFSALLGLPGYMYQFNYSNSYCNLFKTNLKYYNYII